MYDPVQHAFEAEAFEVERGVVSVAVGQEHVVEPDPQVAEHQRHRDEQQPQPGLARAGINPCLPQLAKARFDASWELVVHYMKVKERDVRQLRLQRSITHFQRP